MKKKKNFKKVIIERENEEDDGKNDQESKFEKKEKGEEGRIEMNGVIKSLYIIIIKIGKKLICNIRQIKNEIEGQRLIINWSKLKKKEDLKNEL